MMTYANYVAECKLLFNADRYGWSVWEVSATEQGYEEGISPERVVERMSDSWCRRKANRNM